MQTSHSSGDELSSLLTEMAAADVTLRLVDGQRIEATAPRGGMSLDLRTRIARNKAELVDWLANVRPTADAVVDLPEIRPARSGSYEPFPPSDLQMSFLVGSREELDFHVRPHQYMELDLDDLDPVRFEQALNRALHRQRGSLVVVHEGTSLRRVRDPEPVRVSVADLRDRPPAAVEAGLEQVREQMRRSELPLDRWPWMEVRITRCPGGRSRLHYNNNNFFSDGPGTARFLDGVLRLYREPDLELPDLELTYRDCVLALVGLEESPLGERSRAYWSDRMADWPDAPELPLATGADARVRSRLDRRELVLPAADWARFKRRAADRGLTPTNALHSVYAEVLSQWTGSRHFLLNNMVTHRFPLHPQILDVVGNFASLYPLEVDWRHDEPFTERALRLQRQVLSDMEHVYWSGVKVLQQLNQVRRTPGRAVCPYVVGSGLFMGHLDRPVVSHLETPQVLLDCQFWEQGDGSLWVVWDLIEAMFPAGLVDDLHAGYATLLTRLATGDEAWLAHSADLLPDAQRRQRTELNRWPAPAPEGLLHDALPVRAAEPGGRPAVVTATATLTYRELGRRVERLAELLVAAGARPGDLVAVLLPKGWEQVVAVLATLAAGGVYVPLDPSWPEARIGELLDDTAAVAVLTGEVLLPALAAIRDLPAVPVDGAAAAAEPTGARPAAPDRDPTDPAYVIFTSGSTGRPKGAVLDHRGPLNTVLDINRRLDVTSGDVVFGISALWFDLSVYDVFGVVAAGATLLLPDPARRDPAAWVDTVRDRGVTVWNSVPALMQLFAEAAVAAGVTFPALRVVLLSGDWIPVDLPDLILQIAPNARVISLGGATEASIWSIHHPIAGRDPDWVSVPYGVPLTGQSWHVLDGAGRDAPTWVPGELYIGGVGVALGYFGDPVRTAEAFVAHPRTGERLYRTGDLGRYLPDGTIEFLGRADFQVKIQGYRVEPGEVEHVLLQHPAVTQAAVVARDGGSGRQLAGYVLVADGRTAPDADTLREYLAERLPGYLVPGYLTVLDQLPLTGNGKVDRKALEALGPAEQSVRQVHVAPRTPTETELASIWADVLDVRPVGVHDDFFDLGGQSFAALRVLSRIQVRFGRRVPLGVLLERRTVAGLAEHLDAATADWSPLVSLRADRDGTPWFLVHPAGGDVLCYRRLADLLDGPVFGLQAPGPAAEREPLERIADFADLYVDAIVKARPAGPYLLAGWSSGAVIAAEVARRLEARGEEVRRLLVVDSPAPEPLPAVEEAALRLWFVEDLDLGFAPEDVGPAERAALSALPVGDQLAAALALARGQAPDVPYPDAADVAATFEVFRGVVRACRDHRAAPIAADVAVVRAGRGRVTEYSDHPAGDAADWGWTALTSGRTSTTVLPGTHHTLLDRCVADVAGFAGAQARSGQPGEGDA